MTRVARSSSIALCVVAALTMAGLVLRWWGPVNPDVSVTMSGPGTHQSSSEESDGVASSTGEPVDPARRRISVSLTNRSRSAVEVQRVRVDSARLRDEGIVPQGAPLPSLVGVRVDGRAGGDGGGRSGRVGVRLGPGESIVLEVDLSLRACVEEISPKTSRRYTVVVDLRTTSGRVITLGRDRPISMSDETCQAMPFPWEAAAAEPPREQPPDPRAARRAVAASFATVYDFAAPGEARAALVDDPHGLDVVVPVVGSEVSGTTIGSVRAHVLAVRFVGPDRATVAYDLVVNGEPTFGTQRGEAVLIDGRWKVTRATVCRDLGYAQITCPP